MADAIPPTAPTACANLRGTSGQIPDNLGGSTIVVGSGATDLQTAISGALNADGTHKGNTYVVPAGVTYNPLVLPTTAGSGFTCIRTNSGSLPAQGTRVTSANAGAMFKVVSAGFPTGARAVSFVAGSSGWRFVGMEATHPNSTTEFGLIDVPSSSRLSFESCYVHGLTSQVTGDGMVRCFYLHTCTDVQIWDSWLSEARGISQDAQAIYIRNGARFHFQNNELQATGENVLIGDAGSSVATTDVTLLQNRLFKPTTWRRYLNDLSTNPTWDGVDWVVKNIFEIKWGRRVRLEGNRLINNWAQLPDGQDGVAMIWNTATETPEPGVGDVLVKSNQIENVQFGATVSYWGGTGVQRVRYENNLWLNVGSRLLMLLHRGTDVAWIHNTAVPMDLTNLQSGNAPQGAIFYAIDSPGLAPRATLSHNVCGFDTYGLQVLGFASTTTDAVLDQWLGAMGTADGREFRGNAIFNKNTFYPSHTGFSYYTTPSGAGINTATGVLASNSPLKAGGGVSTDGTDVGVNFTTLNAALGGQSITASFTATQQPGTLTVNVVDTSTGTPTAWDWNWGDASAHSTTQNATHTYASISTYTITLTIQTASGPTAAQQSITLIGQPVAAFTSAQIAGTTTVQFTDASSGGPSAWLWTFGDGTTSTQQSPAHVYAAVGTYAVTLAVSNINGSNQTAATPVTLTAGGFAPGQSAATTVGAGVTQIQATLPSIAVGTLITAWVNRCDAASIVSGADSLGHTYTALGASVTTPGGTSLSRGFYAIATTAGAVTVTITFGGPTAAFARLLVQAYQPLGTAQFIGANQSTGTAAASPMTSGAVATAGHNLVALIGYTDYSTTVPTLPTGYTERAMTGRNFLADALNQTVTTATFQPTYTGTQNWVAILAAFDAVTTTTPVAAAFTFQQTVNTLTVQFTDASVGTPTSWIWSGPDGFSSTARNPAFTFASSGIKLVQLTVSDGSTQSTSSVNVPVSGSMNLTAVALTWTGQDLSLATGTSRRSLLYDSFNR